MTIPGDAIELRFVGLDRAADRLQPVVADLNRDRLAEGVLDRLDVAVLTNLVELTSCGAGSLLVAWRDAGSGDLGQVMAALGVAQPNERPFLACPLFLPENPCTAGGT